MQRSQAQKPKSNPKKTTDCRYCGGEHVLEKTKCPAFGQTCAKCNKSNHFAKRCTRKEKAEEKSSCEGATAACMSSSSDYWESSGEEDLNSLQC